MPKSALAICYIGRDVARAAGIKAVPAFVELPQDGHEYHRVHIDVIRTKKEAAAAKRQWAKKRAAIAKLHAKSNS